MSASHSMTQHVKNFSIMTCLLSMTWQIFETLQRGSHPNLVYSFLLILHHLLTVTPPPPKLCLLIRAASDEPQLNFSFPHCSSYFNLKTFTGSKSIIICESGDGIQKGTSIPQWLLWSGSYWDICTGPSVCRRRHSKVMNRPPPPSSQQPFF